MNFERHGGFGFLSVLKFLFYFICGSVLPAHTYVHQVHSWCPWRPEECTGSPGTGIRDVGEQ